MSRSEIEQAVSKMVGESGRVSRTPLTPPRRRLREATNAVEVSIHGKTEQDAEILLPGMKPIPVRLDVARDWIENNYGRGADVAPDRTLTLEIDVALLYDFLSGPGVDVNVFITEKPPGDRITGPDDLSSYFSSLSSDGGTPAETPEEPEDAAGETPTEEPADGPAGAAPEPAEEAIAEDDYMGNWVAVSEDGSFVSTPTTKERALNIRSRLEGDGVPMRILREVDAPDFLSRVRQGESTEPPLAEVNRYGDLICPHCSFEAVTKSGFLLQAGSEECQSCGAVFSVDDALAQEANERADAFAD